MLEIVLNIIVVFIVLVVIYWELFLLKVQGAPLVRTPVKSIRVLIEKMSLSEDSYVVDLGCGDGRFLIECCKKYPRCKYIGVDTFIYAVLLARINIWRKGCSGKIEIKKKSLFDIDLTKATHVYVYLSPKLLSNLEDKLRKELKSGVLLISNTFPLLWKEYEELVKIETCKTPFGRKFYLYRF